jgi:hypothetical protein
MVMTLQVNALSRLAPRAPAFVYYRRLLRRANLFLAHHAVLPLVVHED